ncbi:Uncharacterised protein [Streptococcus suis]|uniref:Uncharacterized protein n=1 Tax=Streptococcus suis TaxID=1307 RepID=A0A0Z8IB33_STRSU|nr:Uncharacterised protein [Streptococcus suis]CYV86518.1 Uncharacterised protein [Streptococcus suis]
MRSWSLGSSDSYRFILAWSHWSIGQIIFLVNWNLDSLRSAVWVVDFDWNDWFAIHDFNHGIIWYFHFRILRKICLINLACNGCLVNFLYRLICLSWCVYQDWAIRICQAWCMLSTVFLYNRDINCIRSLVWIGHCHWNNWCAISIYNLSIFWKTCDTVRTVWNRHSILDSFLIVC